MVTELVPQHFSHFLGQLVLVQMAERPLERAVIHHDILSHRRVDAVLTHDVQRTVPVLRVQQTARLHHDAAVQPVIKFLRYLLRKLG